MTIQEKFKLLDQAAELTYDICAVKDQLRRNIEAAFRISHDPDSSTERRLQAGKLKEVCLIRLTALNEQVAETLKDLDAQAQ